MTIYDLPTPALLVDIDAFESNIQRMSTAGKKLRPHAKAHKCVNVAKRQIAAGAIGICVATVPEAELMVRAGIPGVLLTSPLADPRKMARVAALAPDIAVVIDHPDQMRWYSEAASAANVTLNALVDLDVGDHRTGITPGEPALELAQQILRTRNLNFSGLQAYSVRASHMPAITNDTWQCAVDTAALLKQHGIEVSILTGGSTGSYQGDTTVPEVTELQAGSYVFMDEAYSRIEGIPFLNSMTVLATVISATHTDRVTVDAGFKAFSTDRPFGPSPVDPSIGRYDYAGDEFGYIYEPRGLRLGDRVRFIPPHCDPTVNLYDRIHICRGDTVEDVWSVMNRLTS
ncbi:MAG TPA: DSD1 family PLP-dependent enzyme [Bryobacteraceae bacterium]|nr:DSD1 family PLP-dependent enzyme [Bryobacteraceae bacterium]